MAKGFGTVPQLQSSRLKTFSYGWERFLRLFERSWPFLDRGRVVEIDLAGSKLDGIPPVPQDIVIQIHKYAHRSFPQYEFSLFNKRHSGQRWRGIRVRRRPDL